MAKCSKQKDTKETQPPNAKCDPFAIKDIEGPNVKPWVGAEG